MRGKNITEKEFTEIRMLLNKDIKARIIRQLTGYTDSTLSRVRKASTFKEFVDQKSARKQKYAVIYPKAEKVQKEDTVSGRVEKVDMSKEILVQLTRIADALELMEGHWRPVSDGKKKFRIF